MQKILISNIDITDPRTLSSLKEGVVYMLIYMIAFTIMMIFPVQQYYAHRTDMGYFITRNTIPIFAVLGWLMAIMGIILMFHMILGWVDPRVNSSVSTLVNIPGGQ